MEQETPSVQQQPQANWTNEQKQILMAHAVDAGQKIMSIQFTKENHFDMTLAHAFEMGRKAMATSLFEYDQELARQAQQATSQE